MAKKNQQPDATYMMLEDILSTLNQIARNQDIDHNMLSSVNTGVRDTQGLSEEMTTQFKITQQKFNEAIGALSSVAEQSGTASAPMHRNSVSEQILREGTENGDPFEDLELQKEQPVISIPITDKIEQPPMLPVQQLDNQSAQTQNVQNAQSTGKNLTIKVPNATTTPQQSQVVQQQPQQQVPQVVQPIVQPVADLKLEENPLFVDMYKKVRESNANIANLTKVINDISHMLYESYRYASLDLIATLQSQSPNKKRILVTGFYGAPNLGDELMCLTILDYLRAYLPDAELTVMCTNSDYFDYAGAYFGAHILHYPRGHYDMNVIANSFDAIFIGGGALFDDSLAARGINRPGMMNIGRVAVDLPRAFETMNKPVAYLGMSTNAEMHDQEYLSNVSDAIIGARVTTIRDPYSMEVLTKAGVPEDRMLLCPDIIASDQLLQEVIKDVQTILSNKKDNLSKDNTNASEKTIMVSWIFNAHDTPGLLPPFIEEIARLNEEEGRKVKVKLIPFLMESEADDKGITALREGLSPAARKILDVPDFSLDIGVVSDEISECDYAINMRYHGAYLAGMLGLPGVVVSWSGHQHYPNKMRYVSEQFDDIVFTDSARFDGKTEAEKAFRTLFGDKDEERINAIDAALAIDNDKVMGTDIEENIFLFPDDDNEDVETVTVVAKSILEVMEDEINVSIEALEDPEKYAEECRKLHAHQVISSLDDGDTSVDEKLIDARLRRIEKTIGICEDAEGKMNTIMGRLVNSINK